MEKIERIIKKAVETYQCPGCVKGHDTKCYTPEPEGQGVNGFGCGDHFAGTLILPGVGKIFLGMPKGFCRLGAHDELRPRIFKTFTEECVYDKYNVPTWKHLNKDGHTLVRGQMPRRNETFLHIYLEDCRDKIDCVEITRAEINAMD